MIHVGNVIDPLGKFCYYMRNNKYLSDLMYTRNVGVDFAKYFLQVHARCIRCDATVVEDPDRLQ